MSEPALKAQGLTRRFGALVAVEDLDLEVRGGEIVGLLGPNGAGKTTTLSMLASLLRPDSGTISLLRQEGNRPSARSGVGFLVGPPALWPGLSGLQHLTHATRIVAASGWRGHGGQPALRPGELLEAVGLTDRDGRRATREYSQGMRQRLGLAMALAGRPSLLVLDEPTNGLDPLGGPEIWAVLRQAAGEGVAVLVSTHLLMEVERYCDRAPMVLRGRMVHGDVLGLLRQPDRIRRTVFVFGSSEEVQLIQGLEWLSEFGPAEPGAGNELIVAIAPNRVPDLLAGLQNRSLPLPREIRPVESGLAELFRDLARQ